MDDASSIYDAARFKRAGRGKIFDSILDTIGDTPLVRLPNLTAELKPKGRSWPSWSSSTRWPRSRTASAWR
jgi:hypothetical protein